MVNQHIVERLAGIHQMLMGVYKAGKSMSSASKGSEREAFIDLFLSKVLTPQFRFGSGDATDQEARRSGQLDVVVEYPFVPSLPVVGTMKPRLYLAEGVAAAVEVKSDLSAQWDEVEGTASRLSPLQRRYGAGVSFGAYATPYIPLFAIGYTGWKTMDPLVARLSPGKIEGILVIDSLLFASTDTFLGARAGGHPSALWGFISCLHQAAGMGGSTALGVPIRYVV
jgi:hypothetical protein